MIDGILVSSVKIAKWMDLKTFFDAKRKSFKEIEVKKIGDSNLIHGVQLEHSCG